MGNGELPLFFPFLFDSILFTIIKFVSRSLLLPPISTDKKRTSRQHCKPEIHRIIGKTSNGKPEDWNPFIIVDNSQNWRKNLNRIAPSVAESARQRRGRHNDSNTIQFNNPFDTARYMVKSSPPSQCDKLSSNFSLTLAYYIWQRVALWTICEQTRLQAAYIRMESTIEISFRT